METWLSDIEGLFKSGLTDVNFPVEQWAFISSQNNLWTDLAYRTMPLGMRNTPGSIESTTPFSYTFPLSNENLMGVQPTINTCAVPITAPENTGAEIAKGVGTGLYDAGKDFVIGIWDFITNPVESVKGVFHAVTHPVETYTFLKTAISDSYERDVINGDAYSRSRWFSYAVGTVGTSIVGTKGAGALAKTSVATTTSVVQNTTLQSQRLMNMLPYNPRTQLALPGGVPFNVMNGPVIKDQVISIAKEIEVKGAGNLKASKIVEDSPSQIVFGELDNIGRPTGMTATITKEMIGTGSKASQSITPPGFLGGGPGSPGHARGHLLGNQLGGTGKDTRNLVTLYQNPVNSPVMRGFENSVRKAVEKGEIVQYQTTPIYHGNNLIPTGVTLKARGNSGFTVDVTILNRK